ncbi:hypothetical protein FRC00_001475, partial [Tulasnella sp. 408]
MSARDLLATLSRRRIPISEIKFTGNSSQDGGGYADVLVATLCFKDYGGGQSKKIAVKKLRLVLSGDMTEEKFLRVFVNELRLLDRMSHPHVVKILGFVEDIDNRIAWLIFPWEENGNLRKFLRSGKWEIPERVSLPPVCHGDLKSLNILINSSNRAIITDFGSARIVREAQANPASYPIAPARSVPPTNSQQPRLRVTASNNTLTLTGPICSFRWAAPEALNGEQLALESDIWALGWVAWEAITDCYPFEELTKELEVELRIVQGQLPLIYDHHQLSRIHLLCSIMERCWNPDPKKRPSSTECRQNLGWIPSTIPVKQTGEQSKPTRANLLVQLAANHQAGSQYVKAEACYIQALTLYGNVANHLGRANALRGLGHVHRALSEYVQAEADYKCALAIQKSTEDDLGHANTLDGLGDVQRQCCKYVEAEASYSRALAVYTRMRNDLGQANALNGLADVQRESSKYTEAEESYTQALVIYESIGNELGRANALDGLGDVQRERSNYDEAELFYSQALSIYKSIGDDLGLANTLLGLGDIQRQRSKHAEAESLYWQALKIYERVGNDLGQGNALDGLGDAQREQSKFVEAEIFYIQAFEIFDLIGNGLGRANALDGIQDMQRRRSKCGKAEASGSSVLVTASTNIDKDVGTASKINMLQEQSAVLITKLKRLKARERLLEAELLQSSEEFIPGRQQAYIIASDGTRITGEDFWRLLTDKRSVNNRAFPARRTKPSP